jgi:hypothetical protein
MTYDEWMLFWTALASIAQVASAVLIVGSLMAVIPQLKQFRVEGLRAAVELLETNKQFNQVAEEAINNRASHGVDWDALVEQINLVALQVSEGFTNKKLLFIHKGKQLAAIYSLLETNKVSEAVKNKLIAEYPQAIKLLKDAKAWQTSQK